MSAPSLIVPSYSASPANAVAAGCACQQTATTSGTYESGGWSYNYQNYQYTAIAANGWKFKRLYVTTTYENVNTASPGSFTEHYIITDESETVIYPDGTTYTNHNRKAVYDSTVGGYVFLTTFPTSFYRDGVAYSGESVYDPSVYGHVSACSVVAEFEREPTHLLIHDDRANGSSLLVYDDRVGGTGLLVADY